MIRVDCENCTAEASSVFCKDHLEDIKKIAHDEGYEEGYTKRHEDGVKEGKGEEDSAEV